ncbi:aminotransferase class III-fold pyridoxal phosphate-dependent enzyme [Deinococcus deserti]|uniref:Putative Acetylornithine transaminase (Acetylornithine aminotransferase) putative ornithine aminotransferase n=1 Tax=Deinococcus deserti (strain DSM 17065 / CIP 109153 / LMG 22923 / VCD115) TaxID=546414 RepID=C1CV13_DEIDV|nr:aminotransferase class III-fold pyridoxal phosphate-dependent enzyme [Deinococcus deserti]ACO46030.1 putative Acetylornithine transaminase (acetylornithine aminotransferase); putative ornithine aminotransferase [Deinococcus deserti VCD115]
MTGLPHGFIRSRDVLEDRLTGAQVRTLELQHGNEELLYGLDLIGVAGPFSSVTPWELEDEQGVRRINASGYSATPFGEMPLVLTDFLKEFLEKNRAMTLPQQSSSPWRAALEANLVRLLARELPSHQDSQVFFCSSGTEAIEGALKFARAWRPGTKYSISFNSGYHGKTLGSLSLTPNPEYQDVFRPLVPGAVTCPYGDLDALSALIRRLGPDKVTCVVVEPIQGEGGVNIPPEGFLRGLGELCRRHGIVVIADEIQTGLGRTGHWFESAAHGLDPDIVTLAKPLGGGLVAVGATIVRHAIYKKMLGGLSSKRHSNTFGGGALAMAVGLRSLEHLIETDLPRRSLELGEVGLRHLQSLRARYPRLLQEVRGQGLLLAMQFQPVVGIPLPGPVKELVYEGTAILALRELHQAGVMANLSLSSKRTVRLTPALDMPRDVFEIMFGRVDTFAARNPASRNLLTNTPAGVTMSLAKFAASKPKKRTPSDG